MQPRSKHPRPSGFTLIEILIVIVIIALLMALLLPAIIGALHRARTSATLLEMHSLTQAMELFHTKFGYYPPSRIRLRNDNMYNPQNPIEATTVEYLHRFWPRFPTNQTLPPNWFDPSSGTPLFNNFSFYFDPSNTNASSPTATFELYGDQCLVFFLGGMYSATDKSLDGFSADPAMPFTVTTQSVPSTVNRVGPFYEFKGNRLRVVSHNTPAPYTEWPGPSYQDYLNADPQNSIYIFMSAYNTPSGYMTLSRQVNGPNGAPIDQPGFYPYYPPYTPLTANAPPTRFFNPTTYQIVSPGLDGQFGNNNPNVPNGGVFDPKAKRGGIPVNRSAEWDNLTNFYDKPLGNAP